MKKIISVTLIVMVGIYIYYSNHSGKILKYWIEQKELNYYNKQDRDYLYRVSIIETTRATGLFTTRERHYEIFISKQSVKPELDMMYGHHKEYGFEGEKEDVEKLLNQCQVRWEKEGIWFIEADGHKLFFPKSTFMGGR